MKQRSEGLWFKASPRKQLVRPYLDKKWAGGMGQGVGPEFKPQYNTHTHTHTHTHAHTIKIGILDWRHGSVVEYLPCMCKPALLKKREGEYFD
jgi:hypothetical protein